MTLKFPDIKVELTGQDGNAFSILGRVSKAMRKAGRSDKEVKEFCDEAMTGDYDHLLRTCMEWVDVT